nr:MAG TPA: IrrE N-terminal-like domain [Caudoviricetes sp.]
MCLPITNKDGRVISQLCFWFCHEICHKKCKPL